jgi:catecholate siderophore receptor
MARPPRWFRAFHTRDRQARAQHPSSPPRAAFPWLTVGALVASSALGATAHAQSADGRQPTVSASRHVEGSASQPQPSWRFEISAGPLPAALASFSALTGITVVVDPDLVAKLTSPGVVGSYTAEQALRRLLDGLMFSVRFTTADTVTLDLAVTEFVEVAGRTGTRSARPTLTEPLRDIPQTISVVPAAVIEEQGASTLRDVLRNVVGITFQAGEGGVPAGDQMTIRGFSARTDMFVDGVRDFGGYSRDPFNVEQVEVAKGPSSVIAGRGSTGGAINLVTKMPHLAASHHAIVSGGNADYKRGTLDINQPIAIGPAGTAVRLNAMWTDTAVPGRDVVEGQRWGVAPSLTIGLGTPTRLTAAYSHLDQDNVPEYGLPWVPANTNPELAAYANGMPPVDQGNFYGLRARDYEETTTDIASLQIDHDFSSAVSVRNLTRYGTTSRDSVITAPRFASVNTSTAINRQLQSRDMVDDIVANQTNLTVRTTAGATAHAVVAGAEFGQERSENFLRTGPTAPVADLFAPNPNDPYPGPITRTGARNTGEATSAAAYVFDTVTVGSHWEFSGGMRWDRFAVDYETLATTGAVTAFARTDDMVSWRGGAVYKPRLNASIYLGYGSSFNPSAEGLALSAATVDLEPEKTRSYEIGTKWDVAGEQLSLTAAAFRTEKTNARTPGLNPGDPPTVLAGEQRVSGVEFGASGRITSAWTAFGAYSFMHSDIAASNTVAEIDNALALTPEHTLSLWTTVQLSRGLSVGGGAQYMDAVFRNATNSAIVPSYWLVNALAEYEVNTHLTLRLNINNLTDERYVDRVGGGHYIPGAGRSIQLSSALGF